MTASLTPSLTLAYVHALSADVRGVVVLDSRGAALAGPPALAAAARSVLASAQGTLFTGSSGSGGTVYAARDDRHSIVAVTGPRALSRLTLHDLRTALAALGGVNPGDVPPTRLDDAAVCALLSADEDRFRRPRAV